MARLFFTLVFASVLALATMYQASAVQYFVEYKAGNTPGGKIWKQEIGEGYSKNRMELATNWVWNLLRVSNVASHGGGASSTWNTQSVTLVISSDYNGVARTSDIGQLNAKITFGAKYFEDIKKQGRNVNEAFYGVLVHEMTHVWQWHGGGNPSDAAVDVVEGIADYVRLKAGLVDPTWVKNGGGGPWDKRYYGITARFFDYITSFVKRDFVILLNEKMKYAYNENYFKEITGKTVSQLWRDYKHHYNQEL